MVNRVPGMSLIPLESSTVGLDPAIVFNDLLPGLLGHQLNIPVGEWLDVVRRRHPTAALHIPTLRAPDGGAAKEHAAKLMLSFLDLAALRRRATPRVLAALMLEHDAASGQVRASPWFTSPGYTGNLATGELSGEDVDDLVSSWTALDARPRAQLWMSLNADALADPRIDYRIFRAFNLLEEIASEVVPKGQVVCDAQGAPYMKDKKNSYTTKEVRGSVLELLRKALGSSMDLESFATPVYERDAVSGAIQAQQGDLWSEIGLWVKIRNRVAHDGTIRQPEGQPKNGDFAAIEAEVSRFAFDGSSFAVGLDAMHRCMVTVCESVVRCAMAGKI